MTCKEIPPVAHLEGFKQYMQYVPEIDDVVWKDIPPRSRRVKIGARVGSVMKGRIGARTIITWGGTRRHYSVYHIAYYLQHGEWIDDEVLTELRKRPHLHSNN